MQPADIRALSEAYNNIYKNQENDLITDDIIEEIVEELIEECVDFGYTIDEALIAVEDAADEYFDEAKVTYGSDTESPEQRRARAQAKVGEKRKAARKAAVKGAVERVRAKASGAKAAAGIAASIAKDEARRAGRKAVHSVQHSVEKKKQEVKSGIKGFLGKAARKVASKAASAAARLGEEAIQEADSVAAMRERAAKRRHQRYGKSGGGGRDDYRPYTEDDYKKGEENDPRKKVKEDLEIDEARAIGSARSGDQNPKGAKVRVSSGRGMTMTPARGLGASKPKGSDAKRKNTYDAQVAADRRAAAKERAASGEDKVSKLIRSVQREELEATGLFSQEELDGIFEQMTTQTQIKPNTSSGSTGVNKPPAAPVLPKTQVKKDPKLGAGTPGFGYGVGTGP